MDVAHDLVDHTRPTTEEVEVMFTRHSVLAVVTSGVLACSPSQRDPREIASTASQPPAWKSDSIAVSQTEVVLVFLGASWCGASTVAELAPAVQAVFQAILSSAKGRGLETRRIGVWMDKVPDNASKELARFGSFDEHVSGGSWLNLGALRYMWEGVAGPASVPQVLVTSREIVRRRAGLEIGRETLLLRLTGAEEIMRWSRSPRVFRLLDFRGFDIPGPPAQTAVPVNDQ